MSGPLGFDPEYRDELPRQLPEFIANTFPRVGMSMPFDRSMFVEGPGNEIRLIQDLTREVAERTERAIASLTDETLAKWLTSQGWKVQPPPVGQ